MKLLVIFLIISGVSANEPICDRTSRKCYQTVSDLADFSTAESKCSSLSGNLTSVENAFENAFINGLAHAYFGQSQSSFWIGANDFSNTWNWVDGSDWTYTNWASGQPSQTTCAAVTMNTGKWITSQPNEKRPFICVVPPPKVAYCETGWLINHATLSCYRYNGFVNSLSGEQRCVDDEAHLTSIHSLEEQQIIVDYKTTTISLSKKAQTLIGLRMENQQWKWSDGSTVDYTNWARNEPNPNNSGCVILYQDNDSSLNYPVIGQWATIDCNTQIRTSVCKKRVKYGTPFSP